MTKNDRIALLSINDYLSLREKKCASNVAWHSIKSMNTHLGLTVWQVFQEVGISENHKYDPDFEPSLTHVRLVAEKLNKKV